MQRGNTIAELLSVVVVLGLILSAVALIIGPLLRSQPQTQAKVDTVQAAAMALYRLERDIRNTSISSIWVCTTDTTPACTQATTLPSLTTAGAIVMPSAYQEGTGQFQLQASGKPNWQGATVYWVDASGDLEVGFNTPSTYSIGNALTATDAQNAVLNVTASGGMHLARFTERLALAVPSSSQNIVLLQLQARSTIGEASNETTYQTHLETRNN
jgi:hypothetical protein